MNAGLILATGRSDLFGSHIDPAFLTLGARPVLAYCLQVFERCPEIEEVVVVVRRERVDAARSLAQMFGSNKVKHVVAGGGRLMASVRAGLEALSEDVQLVSLLDGLCPCVPVELTGKTLVAAKKHGAGIAAKSADGAVKSASKAGAVTESMDAGSVWIAQSPQSFKIDVLRKAVKMAESKGWDVADAAEAVERSGGSVRIVPSTAHNIRITSAEDLVIAAAVLKL